jgi:DNA (cytosine-5)-methyltransferase 3A
MNVLSLFDGMSCGQIALQRAGIKVDSYYSSEIKEYAVRVTQHNFPNTIQLGDITNWREWDIDWSSIDLVIGGSPCQDLSGANKERLGLKGLKSKLFYTFVDILNHVQSINIDVYFLLENVKMTKENESVINMLMGMNPININSSLFSAQLRNRFYWTNIPFDKNISDNGSMLQDILDSGFTDRAKSRALLESDSRPLKSPVKMFHRYYAKGFQTVIFNSDKHYRDCVEHYNSNFNGLKGSEINYDGNIYDGIRFLSQAEMEKLQTVPSGYTSVLDRNDAACLLGDGWTVDVIAHIFKGLI